MNPHITTHMYALLVDRLWTSAQRRS